MIRRELPEEEREVENLIRESFWNVYRPGCLEHFVMHCLRRDPAFIPELNLVMRVGERLIGHGIEVVGVHFTILGASLFFPAPLDLYAGQMVPLEAMEDCRLLRLEERVMEAPDCHTCWQLMDGYFEEALKASSVDAMNLRRLHRAISYGMSHLHEVRMAEVASEACLGERQFGRLFASMVGMTPKEFLRLQRYHRTVADLKQSPLGSTTLTEVAWRNGYYDYSHMSSDFRKICGYAPMMLLRVSENDGDEVGWRI